MHDVIGDFLGLGPRDLLDPTHTCHEDFHDAALHVSSFSIVVFQWKWAASATALSWPIVRVTVSPEFKSTNR
jgi:hypothetical protein